MLNIEKNYEEFAFQPSDRIVGRVLLEWSCVMRVKFVMYQKGFGNLTEADGLECMNNSGV